jgi:nucleotide-binding universal stress UspA family protein
MRSEIVVGLDNSPSAKAALNWAAEQARSLGAGLRAVHVLDWPYGLSSVGFPAPVNYMDVRREEIEDSYREEINAVFETVSPLPNWILQFASGDTGHILVEQSQDARLLVVGTREHAGLRRLLSGSVSHYCLSHAACPVVALPAPAADRTEDSETVRPETIEEIDEDLETVVPAPEKIIDEAELSGKTLLVAGVDASAESLAAAHYAVTAAELRGGDVLLVHAYPPPPAVAGHTETKAARAAADKLLAAVTAQLVVPPQLHVYTRAEPGDAVTVLKESAGRAAMLVLGRDRVSWFERLLMGAVTSQVVGQVACPLVVVPRGRRARHAWPRLPVIVALDGETAPEPALKLAFEEARLRDARLIVLHAQPMNASARDVTAAGSDLGNVLERWKQDHPDVAVSSVIVSGDPDTQLVRWSRSAAVLVIGQPHQRRWGSWTRSVARSVMKQTHCPLLVAPNAKAKPREHSPLAEQALT